jgi:Ser-tRNA(Ala) deacylase AlaX
MQRDEAHLPPTDMIYMTFEGNWMMECESTILDVSNDDSVAGTLSIVLDRTVLHAQGGGQPTDTGRISLLPIENEKPSVFVEISKVLLDRSTGIAQHTGKFVTADIADDAEIKESQTDLLKVGDRVLVAVNEDNRRLLSECHTAGHVVDSTMVRCGLQFQPSKAYHFLEGPYVEYTGTIPESDRERVLGDLQSAFCQLVNENIETEIALLSKAEADQVCNRVAQNFDTNVFCDPRTDLVRVVTVAGYPCPCGGTHVRSTGDLAQRQWGITAIKCKKGIIRVKYGQGVALPSAS